MANDCIRLPLGDDPTVLREGVQSSLSTKVSLTILAGAGPTGEAIQEPEKRKLRVVESDDRLAEATVPAMPADLEIRSARRTHHTTSQGHGDPAEPPRRRASVLLHWKARRPGISKRDQAARRGPAHTVKPGRLSALSHEGNPVAIVEITSGALSAGGGAKRDSAAEMGAQCGATRDMIGMDMGFERCEEVETKFAD